MHYLLHAHDGSYIGVSYLRLFLSLNDSDYIVWNHGLVLAFPPSCLCVVLPSFVPRGGKAGCGGDLLRWQPQKPEGRRNGRKKGVHPSRTTEEASSRYHHRASPVAQKRQYLYRTWDGSHSASKPYFHRCAFGQSLQHFCKDTLGQFLS